MTSTIKRTLIVFALAASFNVVGCASNDKDDFDVTIEPPRISNLTVDDSSPIFITFKQSNGKVVSRAVSASGSYIGSEDSSLSDIRAKAIEAMIKSASDEVNGQLVSNSIHIRQKEYGRGQLEEMQRDVVSQSVGLGRLVSKPECRRGDADGRGVETTMTCEGKVAVPLIENVTIKRKTTGD